MNIRAGKMRDGLLDIVSFIQRQQIVPLRNMVEIGSFRGDSTKIWAEHFKKIYAIDPWLPETTEFIGDGSVEEVEAAFQKVAEAHKNITPMKMTSEEAFKLWKDDDSYPDLLFAYIDGDHSYEACRNDILAWGKFVAPHGYIGIHDVNVREGVNKALQSLWPELQGGSYVTHFCDTSILIPATMVHKLHRKGVRSEYED